MREIRPPLSLAFFAALFLYLPHSLPAQSSKAATPPNLYGVYQVIGDGVVTPDGFRNVGSPSEIPVLRAAAEQAKTVNLKQDPAKMCQPIGPFRMMARPGNKIEIMPTHGMIVMLFEDVSRGLLRTIDLSRGHVEDTEQTWQGDSVGRWDGDTLIIDTNGFNDRTWFNEKGLQHSDLFHLVERIRPVLNGKYLEYRVTAEDPKVLAKPYSYTRYYEKVASEVTEDYCEEEE